MVLAGALCAAWLAGAFIRSLGDGSLRWWPGTRAFASLTVLYLVSGLVSIGIALVGTADESAATAWLALLMVVLVSVPVMFADYAIVLEDRGARRAASRAARGIWLRRPGDVPDGAVRVPDRQASSCSTLFVQRIQDADGVFPGFFGAQLLVQALLAYASDCILIALLLETPDDVGYCTRIRDPGVSFSGSTFGFSTVSRSTDVLKRSAIDENDSPVLDAVILGLGLGLGGRRGLRWPPPRGRGARLVLVGLLGARRAHP